jgi:DNA-binding beta-propeller fold protein YncE
MSWPVAAALPILLGSAVAASSGELAVVASGRPLATPGAVAVSPDGKTLYVSDWGASAIFKVPARGGAPTVLASLDTTGFYGFNQLRSLAISPDGDALYVAGWGTGTVFKVSTKTRAHTLLFRAPDVGLCSPHGIAVSPDGAWIYVTDNLCGRVHRAPAAGGAPVVVSEGLQEPLDVAVSPDGGMLYVAAGAGSVFRVPAPGGPPELLAGGPPLVRPTGISVSPDGTTLVIVDDAGLRGRPPSALYTLPAAGGALSLLHAGEPLLYPPAGEVSSDGRSFFVADCGYDATGAVYRLELGSRASVAVKPGAQPSSTNPGKAKAWSRWPS